jgi:hypothetical protein
MFSKDLAKFANVSIPKESSKFFRKVTLATYQGVITSSPVDTGRFRLSWRVSVNNVNQSVSSEPEMSRAYRGAPPMASETANSGIGIAFSSMHSVKNIKAIYISNNLPYASALEKGSSPQARNGIVKLVAQQVKYKLARMT